MILFLETFFDLSTSRKELCWRKSFLSMLLGAGGVRSTMGCHGHMCNGCEMHGPGCYLCDGYAIARSDSRWFISA